MFYRIVDKEVQQALDALEEDEIVKASFESLPDAAFDAFARETEDYCAGYMTALLDFGMLLMSGDALEEGISPPELKGLLIHRMGVAAVPAQRIIDARKEKENGEPSA